MSKPQKKPLQPWAEQMIEAFHLAPLDDDEYFVQWETGRLGVNISEDKESELPYVSKITDANSPLAAAMEVGDYLLCVNELRAEENSFNNFLRLLTTKQKPVGDTLVSANGLLSRDHPFGEFFAALQKMSKPIQLVFAPSTAPESDDESTSGRHSPTHSDDVIVRDPVDHEAHRPRPPPPPRSPASRVDLGSKEHAAKGDDRESKSPAAAVSPEQVLQYPPPSPKAECSSGDVSSPAASVAVAAPVPVPDERPYMSDDDDDVKAALLHGHSNPAHASRDDDDDDDDGNVITDVDLDLEPADDDEDDDAADAVMPTLEFIKGAPPSTSKRQGRDSPTQTSSTTPLARPTTPLSSTASGASNSSSGNNERTGGSRRGRSGGKSKRNFTTLARLPRVNELEEQTIALVEPNSVNMKLTVRGRLKSQRVSKADTPDSSMYLIKWKENRSIGVQLRECRLAKGVYPMVVLVCREACCESLRHVQIGDLLVEINGRDTAMMSVKKTIAFVKTCTKTALLKFKRGPGISVSRVSA
ncbi:hypothetical protein DYB32_005200 [Aphanomyces invadans]|uniref:PDZ domain-containing protein n=1 Tax=Aphanomyces invadans TaxID=157072 RepID=A0A418AV85_9STRA|nr:hypothetical protein DYB32_005200 [Aphanomyces invadans]